MSNVVRINITVPKGFVARVKEFAPNGNVSKYIVESMEEELARKEKKAAMKFFEDAGPLFPHIKDSVAWVNELRAQDEKRMERLGLGVKDIMKRAIKKKT